MRNLSEDDILLLQFAECLDTETKSETFALFDKTWEENRAFIEGSPKRIISYTLLKVSFLIFADWYEEANQVYTRLIEEYFTTHKNLFDDIYSLANYCYRIKTKLNWPLADISAYLKDLGLIEALETGEGGDKLLPEILALFPDVKNDSIILQLFDTLCERAQIGSRDFNFESLEELRKVFSPDRRPFDPKEYLARMNEEEDGDCGD